MAEQPPKSFSNDQSSYLARVLRAIEIKLNNVIAGVQSLGQSNIGPNVAGTGPVFKAQVAATSLVASTETIVNFTEIFDTNNCFASNRFTPNVAGYYLVTSAIRNASGTNQVYYNVLKKNGVQIYVSDFEGLNTSTANVVMTDIVFMNGTTDYLEIFAVSALASTWDTSGPLYFWSGCLIRAA